MEFLITNILNWIKSFYWWYGIKCILNNPQYLPFVFVFKAFYFQYFLWPFWNSQYGQCVYSLYKWGQCSPRKTWVKSTWLPIFLALCSSLFSSFCLLPVLAPLFAFLFTYMPFDWKKDLNWLYKVIWKRARIKIAMDFLKSKVEQTVCRMHGKRRTRMKIKLNVARWLVREVTYHLAQVLFTSRKNRWWQPWSHSQVVTRIPALPLCPPHSHYRTDLCGDTCQLYIIQGGIWNLKSHT